MLEREAKIPPLANMYIRNVGFGGTKISNVTLQETKIAIDIPPTFFSDRTSIDAFHVGFFYSIPSLRFGDVTPKSSWYNGIYFTSRTLRLVNYHH